MKKNSVKLGLGLLTVLATPLVINSVNEPQVAKADYNQGWKKTTNGLWYYLQNGQPVRNKWVGDYWLGSNGIMATNAWVDNGRYYVGTNGAWVKNAKKAIPKKQGWVKENGLWLHYSNGVTTKNAWVGDYWLGRNGVMATNAWVDNGRYYVGQDGSWVKNAKKEEPKKQGWVKENGIWYHYEKGVMTRNAWKGNYWLGSNGVMATNAWVDNGRYYVGADGAWIPNYNGVEKATPNNSQHEALPLTYYNQRDPRWTSKRYGYWTMGSAGCVPTSIAMVVSNFGKNVNPTAVADYLYSYTNEFNKQGIGTTQTGAAQALHRYGLKYRILNSKSELETALKMGQPVLAAVGPGTFVVPGYTHEIVLSGYKNGLTQVKDPDSTAKTNKWYSVQILWNQRSFDPIDTQLGSPFMAVYQ